MQGQAEPGAVPGLVRRVRRVADLSQRGLAARLGVSQSTVARWETGEACPTVAVLQAIADLAGLRVALVDDAEHPVPPMAEDRARDLGGRRYPAHSDVEARGWWTPRISPTRIEWLLAERRSRELEIPHVYYHRGGTRRLIYRLVIGATQADRMCDDHPTEDDLLETVREAETRRLALRRRD